MISDLADLSKIVLEQVVVQMERLVTVTSFDRACGTRLVLPDLPDESGRTIHGRLKLSGPVSS